jgi:hypothetical protein
MGADLFKTLVSKAILAPSVHNVQPARWHIEGGAIVLVEDMSRRLLIGDPTGNDIGISLGAALEGLSLAASEHGFDVVEDKASALPDLPEPLRAVGRFVLRPGAKIDPLASFVESRASWRGGFVPHTQRDLASLKAITTPDAAFIFDQQECNELAKLYDQASYGFMRQTPFRNELKGWMRLSKQHPSWAHDGLNADAMVLSPLEAAAASFVLGPAFPVLDKLSLAPTLLAEGEKIKQAACVVLFHRDRDETPFTSGRHFYRLWLALEAAGFGGAVLAALADDLSVANALCLANGIEPERRLVSAFRIGRLGDQKLSPRARLSIDDVLV